MMSRLLFATCCGYLMAASWWHAAAPPAAGVGWAPAAGNAVGANQGELSAACVLPAQGPGQSFDQMPIAAEFDDVDAAAPRLRLLGKTYSPPAVRRSTGSSPVAWAHDADFFPNTLHVRLQV